MGELKKSDFRQIPKLDHNFRFKHNFKSNSDSKDKNNPVVFMFGVKNSKLKRPESDGTQIKLALSTIKDDRREELKEEIRQYRKAPLNKKKP